MARSRKHRPLTGALTGLLVAVSSMAQQPDGADLIPIDPEVRTGTLDNGLRYYVRPNQTPPGRASLRLVVAVGSLAEEESERGAAHFVEHMAFEDTEHFPNGRLIPFLQSLGNVFGNDINGRTSHDRTNYHFDVPTTAASPEAAGARLDSALMVLEDWAGGVRFGVEDVDDERRTVLEEVRLKGDVVARFNFNRRKDRYRGSLYARESIGLTAVLDTIGAESLRRFYRTWYRPELMAVVAVGDFDADFVESEIRRRFAALPRTEGGRPVPVSPVPDHEETRFSVFVDPELPAVLVEVAYIRDVPGTGTLADFRAALIDNLANRIMNERLDGVVAGAEPPFVNAGFTSSRPIRPIGLHRFFAEPGDDGIESGFAALLSEIERVRRFGFTDSELERHKRQLLGEFEGFYNERDRIQSGTRSEWYEGNFLWDEPIPSIEYSRDQALRIVPGIDLAELHDRMRVLLGEQSRVVTLGATQRDDLIVPGAADLRALVESVQAMELEPFVDSVVDLPLLATLPAPGAVIEERDLPELGATELILENGARVILVPTQFQSDEVLFGAVSPGGTSLLEDADYASGLLTGAIVEASGVGPFSAPDLQKKLAGQIVSVAPFVDLATEGFRGFAAPRDVESLFQLVHLYFTAPRRTEQAFANLLQSLRSNIENNRGNPLAALNRTLSSELWQNHPRVSPLSQALLDQADLDRALAIYRERFADAGDFAFFFVGNLDLQQMRLLAQTYLATLPSTGQPERRRDLGIRPSTGVVEKVVRLGTENISNTAMVFSGTYEYSERSALNLIGLGQLLNLRVITAIRTELGESYSPHATAATTLPPVSVYQVKVSFTSDPQNAERLAAIVLQQSEILRVAGPVAEEVAVLRAQGSFFYSSQLQDNGLWLSNLMARHAAGLELRGILDTPRLIDETTIESLRLSAQTFLNPENLVKVVQVPEDFGMSAVLERQQTSTPEALALEENYPNPFNGETVIHFSLPRRTTVELAVYNLAGQKVAVLVQGMREAGRYSVRWDARDQARRPLASGVYLYKLYAEGDVEGRRLLLLR